MATKITKSELKEMIREALREELSANSLHENSNGQTDATYYIIYNAYGSWNYPDCDLYEFVADRQQAEAKYLTKHIPFFMTGYQPDDSFLHLAKVQLNKTQIALFSDAEANKYEIMDLLKEINRQNIPCEFIFSIDGETLYDEYKEYCRQLGKKCSRKATSLVSQFATSNKQLFN